MNIQLKILILVSFLQIITASQLCKLPEKNCNSKNECLVPTCAGSYAVQCKIRHCARNQAACEYYLDLKKSLFTYSGFRMFNKLMLTVSIFTIVQKQTFQSDEFCQRKTACLVNIK